MLSGEKALKITIIIIRIQTSQVFAKRDRIDLCRRHLQARVVLRIVHRVNKHLYFVILRSTYKE